MTIALLPLLAPLTVISRSEFMTVSPAIVKVDAISTAPSMSTTSRLLVPSTSIAPDISKEPNEPTPVVVIAEEPLSIEPKPEVIDPEFKAPVVTISEPPASGLKREPIAVPPIVIASASRVPSKSPSTASMFPSHDRGGNFNHR